MIAAARLLGLGLRITAAVVGWVFAWVFRRPRWLFPLRLGVLALGLGLVLAANLAGGR